MAISLAWRRFLLFLVGMVPLAVCAFLWFSGFTSAWDGHAVSIRGGAQSPADVPTAYQVLIVEADGGRRQEIWAADLVEGLALPVDPLAVPPSPIPDTRPQTRKSRFSLHFRVQTPDGAFQVVPTTSPWSLAGGLLVLLLGIALRNMVVAGSPFSIEPRPAYLPKSQTPSGQIAGSRGSRPQKGPPPPRRSKGGRRR